MSNNLGTLKKIETNQSLLIGGKIFKLNEIENDISDNEMLFMEEEDCEPERFGYSHTLHFDRTYLNGKMRNQNDPFSSIGFVPLLSNEEYELFKKNTPYCMRQIELSDGSLCIVVLNRFYLPIGVSNGVKYSSNDELVNIVKKSGVESIVFDDTDKKHLGCNFYLRNENNLTLDTVNEILFKSTPFSKLSAIIAVDKDEESELGFYYFYKEGIEFSIDNIKLFRNIDFVSDVVGSYYGDDCQYRINNNFCSWHKLFSSVLFKSNSILKLH
jgi:hypothetical protein